MRDSRLNGDVCLALVAEGPTHGWSLVRTLAPTGDVGRIWSVSRPLVYRALDGLIDTAMVTRARAAPGQGPARAIVRVTARGRRAAQVWLDEPVAHLRDVRTELLVKLVLRSRVGLPNASLLDAQRDRLAGAIETLAHGPGGDPVALWRRENARAISQFLDAAARAERMAASSPAESPGIR
jgi:DNA-binding PadR family transcriptional regulator